MAENKQEKTEQKAQEAPKMSKSKGRPQEKQMAMPTVAPSGRELKGIVRISGKDMRGNTPLSVAITKVKGIGFNSGRPLAKAVLDALKMPPTTLIGELTEQEMQALENVITHPMDFGLPAYLLNRRKDRISGANPHLIGTDLTFAIAQDIEHEKEIYTWKGYRHAYGQKVRGQHSRTTGRTGMSVGVLRKSVMAKMGGAAAAPGAAAPGAAAPATQAGAAAKPAAPKATAAPSPAAAKQEPKK